MINPGVITLASLDDAELLRFPYRFCIEDNIGEAVHIHYKDIRLDLTVKEFNELAGKAEEIINELVQVDGFICSSFEPVNLVGLSGNLPNLKKIEIKDVYLEDILVDTFDFEGNPIFAPINQSRVFQALCGFEDENNAHKVQLNHFRKYSADKITNTERIQFNLEQIKKHGYPYKNNYILLNERNEIYDGQHRASCLYYLYGNIKVPVRILYYKDDSEQIGNLENSEWEKTEKLLSQKTGWYKKLTNVIWKGMTKFGWVTWKKSERDKQDYCDRLSEINQRLIAIENRINK